MPIWEALPGEHGVIERVASGPDLRSYDARHPSPLALALALAAQLHFGTNKHKHEHDPDRVGRCTPLGRSDT